MKTFTFFSKWFHNAGNTVSEANYYSVFWIELLQIIKLLIPPPKKKPPKKPIWLCHRSLYFTVVPIEVFLKYGFNTLPRADQFISSSSSKYSYTS
jgi:hypothetical protein